MVKEQIFKLNPRSERPMLHIKLDNNKALWALFDTGAYIPVWTSSEAMLFKYYDDAEYVMETDTGWFGGNTPGKLYYINFKLNEITYPHMPIFVPKQEQNASFSMILSATMFYGLVYTLDTKNHYLNVQLREAGDMVRNLKAYKQDGKLVVLANN